jgi:hypothetical protein
MPLLPDMLRGWIEGGVHWLVYHIKDLPDWLRKTIGDEILAKGPGFISSMYLGGIIIGLALGIASYPLAWVVWEGFARYNEKRKTRFEPLPEDAPKPKA